MTCVCVSANSHVCYVGGVIVLKDNAITGEWTFVVDRDDSSVARHIRYLKLLIELSGELVVVYVVCVILLWCSVVWPTFSVTTAILML